MGVRYRASLPGLGQSAAVNNPVSPKFKVEQARPRLPHVDLFGDTPLGARETVL